MLEQHRHGKEVVDGPVEESLNLWGVEINTHDAVRTSSFEQIGDEPG